MPRAMVNGVTTTYQVSGQGEPLILIMGFAGSRRAWFLQARTFKKYYRVVVFDNRGVGGSDRPSQPYTTKTMADDVAGLMDHLKIDKAHVLGMSLGGMVAQEVAINYPEKVIKLVLAATFPGGGETEEMSQGMREALGLGEDISPDDVRNVDVMKFMSAVTALSFNKRLYRMILVPLSKRYARSIGSEGLMGQLEASAGCSTLDRLHRIEAPTLVIAGAKDRVVPPGSSDVIASRIPNARLVKLEGGSHSIHMEMRGRFNREVLGFLRGS